MVVKTLNSSASNVIRLRAQSEPTAADIHTISN
jgi:hypothetical protein